MMPCVNIQASKTILAMCAAPTLLVGIIIASLEKRSAMAIMNVLPVLLLGTRPNTAIIPNGTSRGNYIKR